MEKEYTITDDKFLKAKRMITENGGTIYPDGSFDISGVKGVFKKNGNILNILITDKPFLASWGMIENKLDGFFN